MSESVQHAFLSDRIVRWAEKNCGFRRGPIIYMHRGDRAGARVETPPKVGGSTPDVYIKNSDRFVFVLGEAKTPKDLERPHTQKQLTDYLGFCHANPFSIFVLAVPWPYVRRAKNLARIITSRNSFTAAEWVVLDELGSGFAP